MEKHTLVVSGWETEWFLAFCEAHKHNHSQGLAIIVQMAQEHIIDSETWSPRNVEEQLARLKRLDEMRSPEAIRALRQTKFDSRGREIKP